jgi:hypothetical protein
MVEPSLSAAYYATAKSSGQPATPSFPRSQMCSLADLSLPSDRFCPLASTRVSSFLPSALVSSSLALAAVGGLVGVAQVML